MFMKTSHVIVAASLAALPLYGVAAEHTAQTPETSTSHAEMNADGNGEAIFIFDRRDASEDTDEAEGDVAMNDNHQPESDDDGMQNHSEARDAASADHARVEQFRAQARQKVTSLREGIQTRIQAIRAQMSERLQAARTEARERAQAIRAEIRD